MLLEKQLLQSEDSGQSSRKRARGSAAPPSQETITWIELSRQVFQHFIVLWFSDCFKSSAHVQFSIGIRLLSSFFSLSYYLLLLQNFLENETLTIVTGYIGHWVTMMFFEEFLLDTLVPNPLPKKHWKQRHAGTSRKL